MTDSPSNENREQEFDQPTPMSEELANAPEDSTEPVAASEDNASEEKADAKPRILIGSQRDPDAYADLTAGATADSDGEKTHFPPPSTRGRLSPELEEEYQQMLADVSMDDLMSGEAVSIKQDAFEQDSKHTGRILRVRREDVFVELGGREQGVVPLKMFKETPEEGAEIDVIVSKFNRDEGLYELALPMAAASVGDWSQVDEGMVVEVLVSGSNTGGLECELHKIRGFIPISQIALYRVENIEEFVGQKLKCVVTEANPERRNLVLSRRALLEREREEAREKILSSLEPGQTFEGTVRKIMDFGAFVELGSGVDGLLHISELSWGRVNHPSDVLSEGQGIKVKIKKYDPETNRIALAYRDMLSNPWDDIGSKYPEGKPTRGRVVKIMEFGAFVELEPGVEGLVHISELAHKRVNRVSDVVSEGDEVEVMVLSVDKDQQRIGLSIKQMSAAPEPETSEEAPVEEEAPKRPMKKFTGPLKGGIGGETGGEKFGLKW